MTVTRLAGFAAERGPISIASQKTFSTAPAH
jgi:hypothetical protein